MTERVDYDRMASVYDTGRGVPEEWLLEWRAAVTPHLAGVTGPVLDVGSGTGIWSLLLAKWFDVEVLAVEPSAAMRMHAARKRPHVRVTQLAGEAQCLPIRDRSCSAAWISTVVHHIGDLEQAAHELRRVLLPGAPVLIRNPFSGRHDGVLWTRFFPTALEIAERRHPTLDGVVRAFQSAGFERLSFEPVRETSAANLEAYAARIETRADSTLALITDEEFARGVADLRQAAATSSPEPVETTLDLLVLR